MSYPPSSYATRIALCNCASFTVRRYFILLYPTRGCSDTLDESNEVQSLLLVEEPPPSRVQVREVEEEALPTQVQLLPSSSVRSI